MACYFPADLRANAFFLFPEFGSESAPKSSASNIRRIFIQQLFVRHHAGLGIPVCFDYHMNRIACLLDAVCGPARGVLTRLPHFFLRPPAFAFLPFVSLAWISRK